MDSNGNAGSYGLGDFILQSGKILRNARLGWQTWGTLAPDRSNVIVYPTSYSAQHQDQAVSIGSDGVLDPRRWFIVVIDTFGNGVSSSPSNDPEYPGLVTTWDNVQAQRQLLREVFGVERVACVYGWSMGAQQAYHWAAAFPRDVGRIVVNCGSARTAVHNRVFLAGMMAVLEAAPQFLPGGTFERQPRAALRAFARLYAGWALSQDFYRAGLHLSAFGAPDLQAFLQANWEQRFLQRDAADLYAQLRTWEASDISANPLYDGDLEAALAAIEAKVLLMPSATDLYFRVADNEAEYPHLRDAKLVPIPSIWGHRAGNPLKDSDDYAFVREQVAGFLQS